MATIYSSPAVTIETLEGTVVISNIRDVIRYYSDPAWGGELIRRLSEHDYERAYDWLTAAESECRRHGHDDVAQVHYHASWVVGDYGRFWRRTSGAWTKYYLPMTDSLAGHR